MTDASDAAYRKAVAYIDAAPDRAERTRRKAEVFHVIYGNDALRASSGLAGAGITAEQLGYLERRYTLASDQKCVVCGAPLEFSASGERGGGPRYNCSSAGAALLKSGPGLHERLDHYARSAWYDHNEANPVVVALVKAYRELEPRAACPCFDAAVEERLREDAIAFRQEAAGLDTDGFISRTLDALGITDDTGGGDRWEDPRDTTGGETDG
jgi:hypothetical protein